MSADSRVEQRLANLVDTFRDGVQTFADDRAEERKRSADLLAALKAIVDAWGVGDGGKHVGLFIEEARVLIAEAATADRS